MVKKLASTAIQELAMIASPDENTQWARLLGYITGMINQDLLLNPSSACPGPVLCKNSIGAERLTFITRSRG